MSAPTLQPSGHPAGLPDMPIMGVLPVEMAYDAFSAGGQAGRQARRRSDTGWPAACRYARTYAPAHLRAEVRWVFLWAFAVRHAD